MERVVKIDVFRIIFYTYREEKSIEEHVEIIRHESF